MHEKYGHVHLRIYPFVDDEKYCKNDEKLKIFRGGPRLRKRGVALTGKFQIFKTKSTPKIGVDALKRRGRAGGRTRTAGPTRSTTCFKLKEASF